MMRPFRRVRKTQNLTFLAVFAGLSVSCASKANRQPADRPIEVTGDRFVSSRTCRACHRSQYASWRASYHRTMTQVATPQSVAVRLAADRHADGGHHGRGVWRRLRVVPWARRRTRPPQRQSSAPVRAASDQIGRRQHRRPSAPCSRRVRRPDRQIPRTSGTVRRPGSPAVGPAASVLTLLKGDAGQRAIVAQSMGWRPAQRGNRQLLLNADGTFDADAVNRLVRARDNRRISYRE